MGITFLFVDGKRETKYCDEFKMSSKCKCYILHTNGIMEDEVIPLHDVQSFTAYGLSDQARWRHGLS